MKLTLGTHRMARETIYEVRLFRGSHHWHLGVTILGRMLYLDWESDRAS